MIGGLQGEFGHLDIKYLKQNISRCWSEISGSFRRNSAAVQEGCEISQQKEHHFAVVQNLPSAWSDWLPMDVTPSFQVRIMHRLKNWIANFSRFETMYSIHKLRSRKCSKSGWQWLSSRMLHGRFLFASPPCIPDLLMEKDFKGSKLWLFMFLSFPLLCHGFQRTLLNLGLLWGSNY